MTLNLRKLISISTQLTAEACRIIKESGQCGQIKQYWKGQDDQVTDADFKIQTMLIRGFKKHFPQLKIIGQESQQYKGNIEFDYSTLKDDIMPSTCSIVRQIQAKDACLWIDPIDCTRGFIKGNLEDVTTLIGLTYQNKPQIGIIGTSYHIQRSVLNFSPKITVGSVKEKEVYDWSQNKWQKLQKPKINKPLIITSSNSRTNSMQDGFIKRMQAKNITAGGSGRKIMMVVRGQADAMVYLDSWTHKWDSCAGDAIIKAMQGHFTTPFGHNIVYDQGQSTHNKQGMVVAVHRKVYNQCMDSLGLF